MCSSEPGIHRVQTVIRMKSVEDTVLAIQSAIDRASRRSSQRKGRIIGTQAKGIWLTIIYKIDP